MEKKDGGNLFRRFVLIIISTLLLFNGCVYRSKVRPPSQVPSLWVCEEPHIEIYIPEGYESSSDTDTFWKPKSPVCSMYFDEIATECDILFDYGSGITFTLSDDKELYGRCDYQKDYFIFKTESDTMFNGKYKELYFKKVDN